MSPTAVVAYMLLFAGTAFAVVFGALLIGRLLRPNHPTPAKREVYECGEPAVGSGFLQFDLRFYVVALVFIIFDVEVAFFFPWAVVYGKATQHLTPRIEHADRDASLSEAESQRIQQTLVELGVSARAAKSSTERATRAVVEQSSKNLSRTAIADIAVFFAVLLVGFAYVWRRGDLDWVRAIGPQRAAVGDSAASPAAAPPLRRT
jgi:NADH-quinone oxidoreductase subunit A